MKIKGSVKLRRSGIKKGYYASQRIRTAGHKAHRAKRRLQRKEHWVLLGKKKNGKPVSPIKTKSRSTILKTLE